MVVTDYRCENCGGIIRTDRTIHVTEVRGAHWSGMATLWSGTVTLRCAECGRRYEKPISMMVLDDETETV